VATVDALLAVYDQQMRGVEVKPPAGMRYERDGRGIYRALIAARAQRAAARSVKYLQLDASDDSAPILRRLGFRAVTTSTTYVWTPPQSASG
jgi:hypothetical protein